jgi:gamma-glutamylputrescine oxidase
MSNFLYANDRRATYPSSWYAESVDETTRRARLDMPVSYDVCIIGAGFTGLSTALHLAQKGFTVIVLEAHRVGFGASGRNGGQMGSGLNYDQQKLEKAMGRDAAHQLWEMTQEAKSLTRSLIAQYAPESGYKPGVAEASFSQKDSDASHAKADYLAKHYGYTEIECLDKSAILNLIKSSRYSGGILDWGAGHLHPLRYALGLAKAAEVAGTIIYEDSAVEQVQDGTPSIVHTKHGQVKAGYVVHATNGYHGSLNHKQATRVLPINNYLAATAPLTDPQSVLTKNIAVADNRFVLNYYRLSHDNRLIFGGGESYGTKFPRDIFSKVRRPLTEIFPQLTDVELTHAWGGTLGITTTRLPMFARVGSHQLTASGYSGHGVAMAGFAGLVLAETIAGNASRFDLLSKLPGPAFPGGQALRSPIMTLAMTWFSLRDRLGL